jgi:hypothetical protein
MIRTALLAVAALAVSAPAFAQAPTYRAIPATQVEKAGSVVVGETLWACGTDGCTTTKATARPAIVCEQAVKKVGKLTSFAVNGAAFDDAALAKCNAKARA